MEGLPVYFVPPQPTHDTEDDDTDPGEADEADGSDAEDAGEHVENNDWGSRECRLGRCGLDAEDAFSDSNSDMEAGAAKRPREN